MARKKKVSYWEKFRTNTRTSIGSGIFALVVVVGAFLLLNSFSQNSDETKKSQNQKQEQKNNQESSDLKNTKLEAKTSTKVHVVVKGESLSKISEVYYGDKDKWQVIAAENKLANPNIIHTGNALTIPDLKEQTSSIATNNQTSVGKTTETVSQPKTYTVIRGDTLWEISQQFYNGDGYQWFKIRDANPREVGLLPNGRPLITPGTTLTIPID